MQLFLIAGEASGDRLGADLMRGLRALQPDVAFSGIGGPMMAAEGLASRFPMAELSVMGLAEVLPHIPRLLRRVRETAKAIAEVRPDALVTIDSPGFCFRVAKKAKAAQPGLRTIHYVAPSVWAWRPGRAAHMARFVDHVLALLPFEPPYMTDAGMTCDFVGHPIAAEAQAGPDAVRQFRQDMGLGADRKVLSLLPGSRHSELDRMLPVFGDVVHRLRAADPDVMVIVPAATGMAPRVREFFAGQNSPVVILDPDGESVAAAEARKRACFAASAAALAASGTVSLELAAAGVPMVIGYRTGLLTAFLLRRMLRIASPTLVNIVSGTMAVPDFLLGDCTAEKITPVLQGLLDGSGPAEAQQRAFAVTMDMLGRGGEAPGLRAARSVLTAIRL